MSEMSKVKNMYITGSKNLHILQIFEKIQKKDQIIDMLLTYICFDF